MKIGSPNSTIDQISVYSRPLAVLSWFREFAPSQDFQYNHRQREWAVVALSPR